MAEHPGLFFVAATLAPLASFLILLLVGGIRSAARARRNTGLGDNLYELLGGDRPGRFGAYIATAAMIAAFGLSVAGAVQFIEHGPAYAHGGGAHGAAADDHHSSGVKEDPRWAGKIEWARIGAMKRDTRPGIVLELGYRIDSLTVIMFLMVTLVAGLIHIFSIGYMSEELQRIVEDHQVHTDDGHLRRLGRFGRFFMYLSLFCFSMLNLVLADNLFQVFLSWELVGICSYLLIGFYFERQSASNAANKAFIVNRVGDAGFIIGLLIIWTYVGSFNFQDIFQRIRCPDKDSHGTFMPDEFRGRFVRAFETVEQPLDAQRLYAAPAGDQVVLFPQHVHHDELDDFVLASKAAKKNDFGSIPYWLLVVAGLGIFTGCVGKSAQFPLHVWLPDAMEGPTPVSALIHAATMVAAGVYLVGRVFPLFTEETRLVIAYTGAITLFVAATIAMVMTDIKKVLAYSTVSQLGYMMLGLGLGGWVAGLLHLLTHAFFKALMFLCSGSVIYGCHHEQEMTKMGGLFPKMKITALTMLTGVLAIGGTPFFSGWYSKDAIIAQAYGFSGVRHPEHLLLFLLPLITAGITCFYMFRMWFMTFTGEPRDAHVHEHAKESPAVMWVPLVVLAVFSLIVAWPLIEYGPAEVATEMKEASGLKVTWHLHDFHSSYLVEQLEHSQPASVIADFPALPDRGIKPLHDVVHEAHHFAGTLALFAAGLGFLFAFAIYYKRVLDPAEALEQFPGAHRFLASKWYFDELYSAMLVRPALAVAAWCRGFDMRGIDGVVDFTGWFSVFVSKLGGKFDLGIIDGLANVIGDATFASGSWLRNVQTGYLRSYVLFLALAAVALFALLSYFVTLAVAG